jgi:hypothetical protein
VQRPQRSAAHHLRFGLACGLAGTDEVGRADRIDGGIEAFDAADAGVHQFDRRHLAAADQAAEFNGGEIWKSGSHISALFSRF